MTTIRRNWTNRLAEIRSAARFCRAYDSATGTMVPVDPTRAFEAWESTPRAKLTENTPGQEWTVHVHSNRFFVLTAEDPAPAPQAAAPTDEAPAAPSPADTSPCTLRSGGPTTARDHGAERALVRRRRASGVRSRDRRPGHLSELAAELAGKTVRVKLAQGYSHRQIREEFEQAQAEAENAGDTGKASGIKAMLAVHGLMEAEEAATEPPTGSAPADSGRSSRSEPQQPRPGSPGSGRAGSDSALSRIDSVLHDAAVAEDPTVSDDAMRPVPLTDQSEIIHAYTRAQALADGVLVAVEAGLAREAGFRVPVALTGAAWEGCVAWNEGDSERQVPQDETGRLWDVLTMCRTAIRRSGGGDGRVTVDLLRVPRDGRTQQARPVQLVCTIGPGDHGEPVITVMEPHED